MPSTPCPGVSACAVLAAIETPSAFAASTNTRASRWLECSSTAAAERNTEARSNPGAASTACSFGLPTVIVPVLSKTAAFTSLNRSSAPPFRMMMNRFAARLIPPMMATGVARISGHGVATTRIERTRIQSRVTTLAMAHKATVIGVNQTA